LLVLPRAGLRTFNPSEVQALIAAGLRVFVLTATDLTGDEAAEVLGESLAEDSAILQEP